MIVNMSQEVVGSRPVWRLMDVLKEATGFLETRLSETPRLNAERLLAHVLGVSRVDLYLQFDQPLEVGERQAYKALLRRRVAGEPLQYILGETEFMSLNFSVNPHVLIPRPETETLVEHLIDTCKAQGAVDILDVGTGSGAIAVSLAHYLPEARVTALDLSGPALQTAQVNAERLELGHRLQWMQGNLYDVDFPGHVGASFDAIVSNPPYVTLEEYGVLPAEIQEHEPRMALCDEGDGLSAYTHLAGHAEAMLKPGGLLAVEVGDKQGKQVEEIFKTAGLSAVHIIQDLNGIGRVVTGRRSAH